MQAITSKAEHVVLNQAHEAILQTLDRVFDNRFYRSEDFANADAWNGVPGIFAQKHPDLEAFDKDPKAELARINGRIVGSVTKGRIETAGHKRLMAVLDLQDDKEIEAGIAEGHISLSTGFYALMAKDDDGVAVTQGPVTPHHVLLFFEDKDNQPRDLGTGILNGPGAKDGDNMANEKEVSDMAPLLAELNKTKDELKGKGDELANAKAEVTNKDVEIEALKNKLAAIEKADKDAKWESLKNSYVPPGLVAKAEDEKALREMMERDPVAFINKVEAVKVDLAGKGEDGVTNIGKKKQEKNSKDDSGIREEMAKLNIPEIDFEVK